MEHRAYSEALHGLQVKLLKCLIDNIVVDISYAQLGGLYTLGFLETIDLKVGKDHLFKRSIILVSISGYTARMTSPRRDLPESMLRCHGIAMRRSRPGATTRAVCSVPITV